MTQVRVPAIDITDRADGRWPAWDAGANIHKYVDLTAHLLKGDHAGRPAAGAVAAGTLYSCSDHHVIYQSDASAWDQFFPADMAAEAVVSEA